MTRRIAIVFSMAILSFVSLVLVDELLGWICHQFSHLCRAYLGPCPSIEVCSNGVLETAMRAGVYFGPAVAFAMSGTLFSRVTRSYVAWIGLIAALFALHTAIMFLLMQVTGG